MIKIVNIDIEKEKNIYANKGNDGLTTIIMMMATIMIITMI